MSLKSKRILILSTAYLPDIGGSELAIKNITDRIEDVTFDLVTLRSQKYYSKEERMGNVNVYRVGGFISVLNLILPKAFLPLAIAFKAFNLTRRNDYDLVHAYQASQAAGAGAILKRIFGYKKPFLITLQEGKNLVSQSWAIRFFRFITLKTADEFTVISNYLREYLLGLGIKKPIHIIPNGVDTNLFKPQDGKLDLRKELGLGGEDRVIFTASRLVKKNGVEDIIRSLVHLDSNFKLVIAGDGVLMNRLQNIVLDLGLANRVKFLNTISHEELPRYLNMADVFVRPSYSEGLGTAFIEAMASGIPIIGTMVGGIPDILLDGDNGVFCALNDPKDLADKIKYVLEGERSRIMGASGRELAVSKYDWNKISFEVRSVYEKI